MTLIIRPPDFCRPRVKQKYEVQDETTDIAFPESGLRLNWREDFSGTCALDDGMGRRAPDDRRPGGLIVSEPDTSGQLAIGHRPFNQALLIDAITHVAIEKPRSVWVEALKTKRFEHEIGSRLKKRRRLESERCTLGECPR